METSGLQIVALIACGMGGAVWVTDRGNPSSAALALFLLLTGLAVFANAMAVGYFGQRPLPLWVRGLGFMDAMVFLAGTEWGIRVGRTVLQREGERRRGVLLLRMAQGCALVYAGLAAALPELRERELVNALDLAGWPQPGFYLFAGPAVLAGLLVFIAGYRLLRSRPDKAEAVRVIAMLVAMPLLTSAIVLPDSVAPIGLALGEIVFLIGLMRYHVIQGARGQFMAQFLAPQVAQMVREQGLKNAMKRQRMTVTVVCVDIRGFTAHAQANSPEKVLRLLRDFYGSVGDAAAAFGGTIKDLAGDGALVLLGAPVPFDDAAARALGMARKLQKDTRRIVQRHSKQMGLGVGVATGKAAVGIVGQGARYEYVAVGPPVNLSSRLCDEAADGEIRVDAETLEAAGEKPPKKCEMRDIKGVGRKVPTYVLPV